MKTLKWKTKEEGKAWALGFQFERPSVILLSGPMGAGKTQLVKWFLSQMKIDFVPSPTFSMLNRYELKSGAVDHVDLFRFTSDADLESSGFWDLLKEPKALLFVEWADRLPNDVWPKSWKKIWIDLKPLPGEEREVQIKID